MQNDFEKAITIVTQHSFDPKFDVVLRNIKLHPNVKNAVISANSNNASGSYEYWLHSKSEQIKDEYVCGFLHD